MQRKLKTLSYIANRLKEGCIIDHDLKIYENEDLMIVDVHLANFINTVRHINAISQISTQLMLPMYSRHGANFGSLNYFDWAVESAGKKESDACFIRFTIYPKRFIPFMYCNKCGKRTKATYDRIHKRRICPSHGLVLIDECTVTYKDYKRLPKNQRGVKFER